MAFCRVRMGRARQFFLEHTMARLKKVLIVGGGTAGWLAACYLAKAVNAVDPRSVQVHLVESPDIGLLAWARQRFPRSAARWQPSGSTSVAFLWVPRRH